MQPKRQVLIESLDEVIGNRLARLRKERSLSQQELATILKVSQSNVSDYERGHLRLHADVIVTLARVLNVSTDELLGVESSPRRSIVRDRRLLQRLALIERLSKRDKDALLRTITAFLDRMEPDKAA